MAFGEKLRTLRKQTHKSQAQVSKEICRHFPDRPISQTYLSALENMDTVPRQQIINVFAEYYGVQPSLFYDDTWSLRWYDLRERLCRDMDNVTIRLRQDTMNKDTVDRLYVQLQTLNNIKLYMDEIEADTATDSEQE